MCAKSSLREFDVSTNNKINIASLIYTSGSTGKPKAVAIPHDGVIRLVKNTNYINITPNDVIAQIANTSFDASCFEIWGSLLNGARCHIVQKKDVLDFEKFDSILKQYNVTILLCITSLFNKMAQIKPELFSTIKQLIVAGEQLNSAFIKMVVDCKANKDVEISNAYGPTENSVFSTVYKIKNKENIETTTIPIGEPISNTQAYIINDKFQILPDGVIGELALSGKGLASGYFNNSELTQQKFVNAPHPIGKRVYLTGDYVFKDANDQLNFVSRIDNQVKFNGYRIELDEIKSHLLQHEAVQDASIIVDEMEGRKSLVAFVVYKSVPVSANILQEYMKDRLPEHMVPTGYIGLGELPRTINDKLDVRQLKKHIQAEVPDALRLKKRKNTGLEDKLISVWEDTFLKDVSPDSGFYELGGDSITALELVSKAQQRGLTINVNDIFKHSTIHDLVSYMSATDISDEVSDGHLPVQGMLVPSPAQAWLLNKSSDKTLIFNQTCVLNINSAVENKLISKVLMSLVEYHDILRLQVSRSVIGSGLQLYVLPPENLEKHFVLEERLFNESNYEIQVTSICASSKEIVCPEQSVSMHAVLLKNEDNNTNKLVLNIHHLCVDGVSWRIFIDDFNTLLENEGDINALSKKTVSYIEWSNQMYAQSQSQDISLYQDQWGDAAIDAVPLKDRLFSDMTVLKHQLSKEVTNQCLSCASELNVNVGHILLLAFLLSLKKSDLSLQVQLESHGRMNTNVDIDLSRTMGWFTSIYPKTFNNVSITSLYEIVQQMNQANGIGYLFGLQKYLSPNIELKDKLNNKAMPEICFNYLGVLSSDEDKKCYFSDFDVVISDDFVVDNDLIIDAFMKNTELNLNLMFDADVYSQSKIDGLLLSLENNIARIAEFYTHNEYYPLSPAQMGIYTSCLMSPETENYQVQVMLDISGEVDFQRLDEACVELVRIYDPLRVNVQNVENNVVQMVNSEMKPKVSVLDLQNCSEQEIEGRIDSHIVFDRQTLFSLSTQLLIRFTIFQLPNNNSKLLVTFHHLILDGWSFFKVVDSLLKIYEGKASLPKISMNQAFYAAIANRYSRLNNRYFWCEYLKDVQFPQRLNFEKVSPEKITHKEVLHQSKVLSIDEEIHDKIMKFSQEHGLTVNTIVQGAWSILLSEFSAAKDVVFGVTSSGRSSSVSFDDTHVGLFISTLPLCVRVNKSDNYLGFLKALQQNNHDLNQFEHASLTEIADAINIPSGALFDYLYVFENYPKPHFSTNDFHISNITIKDQIEYKLSILVFNSESLDVKFQYNPLFFNKEDMDLFSKYFEQTLSNIVNSHDNLIVRNSFADFPPEISYSCDVDNLPSVVELFESRAMSTPDKTAITFNLEKVTYQTLFDRIVQIESILSSRVSSGDRVAIMMPRSIDYVASMFAILRLGCSFIPLDIGLPEKRIEYIVDTSRAKVVLSLELISGNLSRKNIALHAVENIPVELVVNHECCNGSESGVDHEAYVLFTSGSTGLPKGVSVSCKSFYHFVHMTTDIFSASSQSDMLAISPFIFDISLMEIFVPLVNGASVVLCDDETLHDPNKLRAMLDTYSPSLIQATPASWRMLVNAGWEPYEGAVLISTGEALPASLAKQLLKNGNVLHNFYGPTEATVWATGGVITNEKLSSGNRISIGKTLPGVKCYVLDEDLNQVKDGMSGQLYIGGVGVANGYVGNIDLTNEMFVNIPVVDDEKLYKTGDLVRLNSLGELEYISRLDNQIKKNGHRIELGEIEKCLCQHEDIKQSAVISTEIDDQRLAVVAFIVIDEKIDQSDMNEKKYDVYLRQHLPAYMMPNKIVAVDKIPLLPNKKTDNSVLKARVAELIKVSQEIISPSNETEEKIRGLWSGVLSIQANNISVDDDYFNLGGDSISAITLSTGIEAEFDVYFPVRYIMQYPTISSMAEKVTNQKSKYRTKNIFSEHDILSDLDAPLVPMKVSSHELNIFFIHPIGGTVFRYIPLANRLGKDFNVYGIQDPGLEAEAYLFDSLENLASHYLKVIKNRQPKGPYIIGGCSYGGNTSIEIARKLMDETGEQVYVLSFDSWANYPAMVNNNRDWFEGNIKRQEEDLREMLPDGTNIPELLLDLRWQRQQLIAQYEIQNRPYNFCLFKSGTLSPVLEPIQEDHNHWRPYCELPFDTYVVPGDHVSLLKEPNAEVLYENILLCLEKWGFYS